MGLSEQIICKRLRISDSRFVEIETKYRVLPEQMDAVHKYLLKKKNVRHSKSTLFFDQYLDTPSLDIFKAGASLRIRYKKRGTSVYLQYKGPGFHQNKLLYRSEFVSQELKDIVLEESHHDVIQFNLSSLRQILLRQVPAQMAVAMEQHLGKDMVRKISIAHLICIYQKDKFNVDLGDGFLELSLDKIFVFYTQKNKIHPLSTFCEYENEIKIKTDSLKNKLKQVHQITEFNKKIVKKFGLMFEPQDKYHRSLSSFFSRK